jgi:site-specific recombinase XerD
VKCILKSCDRETVVGRRDYAILLTLSRLGLRGGEIVRLALEDIDWELGELRVCGRPGRTDRLPLPVDVGEAITAYLSNGRPRCGSRHLFVRARAPYRDFSTTGAICDVLRRALKRAGLNPPRQGSYLLRHSVATAMLRQGAALSEIGELLRHRHPDTTAIYAKVDLTSLRRLALPWPEVVGDE